MLSQNNVNTEITHCGCLQRNVGSPELKWELRAKPGLKTTEDIITRSPNIFRTGAAEPQCKKKEKKKDLQGLESNNLENTIS